MKINKTFLVMMSIVAVLIFTGCKNRSNHSGKNESPILAAKGKIPAIEMEVPVAESEVNGGQSKWTIAGRDLTTDKETEEAYDSLTVSLKETGLKESIAENTARILTSVDLTFTAEVGDTTVGRTIMLIGKNGTFQMEAFFNRDLQNLDGTYTGSFLRISGLGNADIEKLMSKCELELQIPANIVDGATNIQKLKKDGKIKLSFRFK